MTAATLDIPADLLSATRMSLADVRLELAIVLYTRGRCSLGKAAAFAEVPKGKFLTCLAERKISPFGDEQQALSDAEMLAAKRSQG